MTLNQLIKKAIQCSSRLSTGDLPIKLNGKEVDIDFEYEYGEGSSVLSIKITIEDGNKGTTK